jgi:hypothetical protein
MMAAASGMAHMVLIQSAFHQELEAPIPSMVSRYQQSKD